MNNKRILPARIRKLLIMTNDTVPYLFEDEADEFENFYLKLMIKHNERLEKLGNESKTV